MAGFLGSCAFFYAPVFIEVSTRDSKVGFVLADVTKGHCYAAYVASILVACAEEKIPN